MKICVLLILSAFSIQAFANYNVFNFTARVDTQALDQLNDMAETLLPANSLGEFETRSKESEFSAEYKKLRTNVEMFLITNGIFFTYVRSGVSPDQLMRSREMNVDPIYKSLSAKNPLLEKVLIDIVQDNANIFFRSAKSSNFYFGKAIMMSAIPGINVLYMLARGSGSYHKDLQEQSAKFNAMQACSLKNMTDDPGILNLQTENCESTDQDIVRSYKYLVSSLYALGFLLKNHKAQYGDIKNHFALGTNFCNMIQQKILDPIQEAQMSGGWIYAQSFGILYEANHCWGFGKN